MAGPGHKTEAPLRAFEKENLGYKRKNATIFRFLLVWQNKYPLCGEWMIISCYIFWIILPLKWSGIYWESTLPLFRWMLQILLINEIFLALGIKKHVVLNLVWYSFSMKWLMALHKINVFWSNILKCFALLWRGGGGGGINPTDSTIYMQQWKNIIKTQFLFIVEMSDKNNISKYFIFHWPIINCWIVEGVIKKDFLIRWKMAMLHHFAQYGCNHVGFKQSEEILLNVTFVYCDSKQRMFQD